MSDFSGRPKVSVVTSTVDSTFPSPFLCRSYSYPRSEREGTKYNVSLSGSSEFTLLDALRATSAAPSYFETLTHNQGKFSDGGLVANNPIELAYFEARKLFPNDEIELIVSVGTGEPTLEYKNRSNIFWLGEVMINIATDSEAIHNRFQRTQQHLDGMQNATVIRFNPPNLGKYDLADASEATLRAYASGVRDYWAKPTIQSKVTTFCGVMSQV
mmetsp:Transcript_1298/g.1744  ORF Transcript_1298/g.1744 Transcript_1298/m.1744 type:complete len:214 (+) Transcript_1298:701-1342(+)|eukprot:CAMPEP_0168565500 /NCGR_PEP_ID=MMETSP0413-20121227/13880_1 /TAXON_ID=136452 /ORGANISM="Filamoeba nolandi, Strain NC-AS-23-1" /LENGTH=213 /DNA_ID=CAMNT_0008597379 /DNA_START=623 /DNA_END=1264 /DNA_ORIENTATION=-